MKVTGPGSTSASSASRRTGRTERSGDSGAFARHLDSASETAHDPAPVEAPQSLSAVDALLAAQSVGDATQDEGRRRAVQRGEDLLDRLDELRLGLLSGQMSKRRLIDLAQMVRSRRDGISDPRLAAVLDEIELRAEVELAKLTRGG